MQKKDVKVLMYLGVMSLSFLCLLGIYAWYSSVQLSTIFNGGQRNTGTPANLLISVIVATLSSISINILSEYILRYLDKYPPALVRVVVICVFLLTFIATFIFLQ